MDKNAYLWSVSHPNIPYFVFGKHVDVVTGVQWPPSVGATNMLTCARDGKVFFFFFFFFFFFKLLLFI